MSNFIHFPELLSEQEYRHLPASEKDIYIKEILRQTLSKNPNGTSISQLVQYLPYSRRTIEKHLAIMERTQEIYSYKLGLNKLYISNHKKLESTSCSVKLNDIEYQIYALHNKRGHFAVIQQRDTALPLPDITGGMQIPLEHFEGFVKYLKTISQ